MRTLVVRVDGGRELGRYAAELLAEDPESGLLERVAGETVAADLPELGALLNGRAHDVAYGLDLYRLLLGGEVGRAWREALHRAAARTFFDIRPAELSALPWELLTTDDRRHLFAAGENPCLRGCFRRSPQDRRTGVPLRMLVIVGEPRQAGPDRLDTDAEVDAIWGALGPYPGEWHIEVLQGPDEELFGRTYRDVLPDVLHFIGHAGGQRPGALRVKVAGPGEERYWYLEADRVANLSGSHRPALAVLNACQTSGAGEVRSVASALRGIGVPGLVTMRGEISSAAAVPFARRLYEGLAKDEALDLAVAAARWSLRWDAHPGVGAAEWAMPCLTVDGDPGAVLPARPAAHPGPLAASFGGVRLADRTAEHRLLWGENSPACLKQRVTLIEDTPAVRGRPGNREVGKTRFLFSCLHTWRLQGAQVCYVDLQEGNLGWLDVLRRIRDGLLTFLPERSAEPVRRFDHGLAALRKGRMPGPLPPAGGETDDGGVWTLGHENEEDMRDQVFAEARALLNATAGERPLVLALDHLKGVESTAWDDVRPKLLAPIAKGDLPQVALVVAGRGEELAPLPAGDAQRIQLGDFPADAALLRQYGLYMAMDRAGSPAAVAEFMGKVREVIPALMPLWSAGVSAGTVDSTFMPAWP